VDSILGCEFVAVGLMVGIAFNFARDWQIDREKHEQSARE
jgi:hypothetical protein